MERTHYSDGNEIAKYNDEDLKNWRAIFATCEYFMLYILLQIRIIHVEGKSESS